MEFAEAVRILKEIYSMELAEPDVMACLDGVLENYEQIVSNTEILIFIVGWQGGTIHQIAEHLSIKTSDIILADYDKMQDLMRLAQTKRDLK